jgi:hypothetical protein
MWFFVFALLGISMFVNVSFTITDAVLLKECSAYQALDRDKQLYVIKNIVKSVVLMSLAVWMIFQVCNAVICEKWDNSAVHVASIIYGFSDVFALLKVPNLPKSTQIHHVSVGCILVLNLFVDYTAPTIWRGAIIYGGISSTTFLVNFYLGIRMLYPRKHVATRTLCTFAMLVYAVALLVTWGIMAFSIIPRYGAFDLPTLLFGVFLWSIGKDDIILMKHLCKNKTLDTRHMSDAIGVDLVLNFKFETLESLRDRMATLLLPDALQFSSSAHTRKTD